VSPPAWRRTRLFLGDRSDETRLRRKKSTCADLNALPEIAVAQMSRVTLNPASFRSSPTHCENRPIGYPD
jgi:hypothetical protein